MSVFWFLREIVFGVTYVLRVQYKMECRKKYFEGMGNGQMTPRGYLNFNSYVKHLLFWYSGQIEGDINLGGLGNLISFSR